MRNALGVNVNLVGRYAQHPAVFVLSVLMVLTGAPSPKARAAWAQQQALREQALLQASEANENDPSSKDWIPNQGQCVTDGGSLPNGVRVTLPEAEWCRFVCHNVETCEAYSWSSREDENLVPAVARLVKPGSPMLARLVQGADVEAPDSDEFGDDLELEEQTLSHIRPNCVLYQDPRYGLGQFYDLIKDAGELMINHPNWDITASYAELKFQAGHSKRPIGGDGDPSWVCYFHYQRSDRRKLIEWFELAMADRADGMEAPPAPGFDL